MPRPNTRARGRTQALQPAKPLSADREKRFTWQPEDIHITYPKTPAAAAGMSDELHTILWSLEHVSNKATFDDAMLNVAHYMADNPGDQLVPEAVRRAEQRVEHST